MCGGELRISSVVPRQHFPEDRRRERSATSAGCYRDRLVEAEPHSGHQVRRETDEPDIGIVVGGPRLSGDRDRRREIAPDRRCGAALNHVAHHVAHHEGDSRIEGRGERPHFTREYHLPIPVLYPMDESRLDRSAEVGEGGVSGNEVERLYHGSADRARRNRRNPRADPHSFRQCGNRIDPEDLSELHRDSVARPGKRFAQRELATELVVRVRGAVHGSVRKHYRESGVREKRVRREAVGDRRRIDYRLERGSGLPPSINRAVER